MKTLDEVVFEAPYSPTPWESDALFYLQEYQRYQNTPSCNGHMALVDYFEESQKNDPLTWDELTQMEGKPVWVEKCQDDEPKGWLLILRTNAYAVNCTTKHGNSFYLFRSLYGEKWQAYRKERK